MNQQIKDIENILKISQKNVGDRPDWDTYFISVALLNGPSKFFWIIPPKIGMLPAIPNILSLADLIPSIAESNVGPNCSASPLKLLPYFFALLAASPNWLEYKAELDASVVVSDSDFCNVVWISLLFLISSCCFPRPL